MLVSMVSVSSADGSSTTTFWNRLSRAPSFSMILRYSSLVVAPMHWNSPRANAGLSMLAASIDPAAEPEPTMVCNSSMKRIMSRLALSSCIMFLMRSSNCPRYFVPATTDARSSDRMRLLKSTCETLCSLMRMASPSTMADLPTPGSPISTGLFFFLRLRICDTRIISRSLPTTGSRPPWSASVVRSVQNWSSAGVADLPVSRRAVLSYAGASVCSSSPPNDISTSSLSSLSSCTMSFTLSYVMPILLRRSLVNELLAFSMDSSRCSVSAEAAPVRCASCNDPLRTFVLDCVSAMSLMAMNEGSEVFSTNFSISSLSTSSCAPSACRMRHALYPASLMRPSARCSVVT